MQCSALALQIRQDVLKLHDLFIYVVIGPQEDLRLPKIQGHLHTFIEMYLIRLNIVFFPEPVILTDCFVTASKLIDPPK